jgi:hypothetical protein
MLPAWWELGTKVSTAAREADFGRLKEERAAVGQADGREGGKRRRRAADRRTVAKRGRPGPRLSQAGLGSISMCIGRLAHPLCQHNGMPHHFMWRWLGRLSNIFRSRSRSEARSGLKAAPEKRLAHETCKQPSQATHRMWGGDSAGHGLAGNAQEQTRVANASPVS